MNIVDERTVAREAAGRRAREEALMLGRLVETMRLASFRSYLAATVCSMSAIVPDVLAIAGADVGSALQRIRPGHLWPMKTSREPFGRPQARRVTTARYKAPFFADLSAVEHNLPLLVGDAIISDGAPGGWIEASIFGHSLEIVLRSDGYELSTRSGVAHLKVAGMLPDTVVATCAGRHLVEVVEHPLLRTGGFLIEEAAQVAGATWLSFNVGQVDIELPWRP